MSANRAPPPHALDSGPHVAEEHHHEGQETPQWDAYRSDTDDHCSMNEIEGLIYSVSETDNVCALKENLKDLEQRLMWDYSCPRAARTAREG